MFAFYFLHNIGWKPHLSQMHAKLYVQPISTHQNILCIITNVSDAFTRTISLYTACKKKQIGKHVLFKLISTFNGKCVTCEANSRFVILSFMSSGSTGILSLYCAFSSSLGLIGFDIFINFENFAHLHLQVPKRKWHPAIQWCHSMNAL